MAAAQIDNVVELGDIENMDVGVGILFPTVLRYFTFGLSGCHIYFRYNATSGDIVDNTIEQLDLENMGVAVGISFTAAVLSLAASVSTHLTQDCGDDAEGCHDRCSSVPERARCSTRRLLVRHAPLHFHY